MNSRIVRYGLFAVVALVAFAVGIGVRHSRQESVPTASTPSAAEAILGITLPDLKGQPQKVDQWRGKVLVVNFWATWCAPCREEIPVFVQLQQEYGGQGLQFVGISIDQADKTSEFAATFKMNYPSLIGTFDSVELSRQAGNDRKALPFTIIFDRNGQIVATELGGVKREKLEPVLKSLL